MNALIAAFREYFELVRANNPQLLHEVFQLRYRVFCEDTRIFDRSLFPEQLERDEYDRRSTHILLQHRPSGRYVGTLRLVLPDPYDLEKPFPVEKLARFDPGFAGVPLRRRRHVAEVSRLAILHHFPHHHRRRPGRDITGEADDKERAATRLRFPHPILALIRGLVQLSFENEVTHWYAIMEPSLDRLLSHFNLDLPVIGPAFDFCGECRPHYTSIQDFLDKAYRRDPEVWELITDCGRLWPAPSRSEPASSPSPIPG